MKTLRKSLMLTAIAVMGIVSCNEAPLTPDLTPEEAKLVTVHFGTENTDPVSTKATLTPKGETAFEAAWENGDVLSVEYISPKTATNKIIQATWDAENKMFSAELPDETGAWDFSACYPAPNASDNSVDFGPGRTQKGNAYNSKYDIMIGTKSTTKSDPGKDDDGSPIVFPMTRQTAIAYFHFTSELEEAITKATLTVAGDGAAIASNNASVKNFKWTPTENCQSITITFPEEAPNAKDFQLWFNVLPTIYDSMTLKVETATKTFTISRTPAELDMYEAGKLYKVSKVISADKWEDKEVTDVITAKDLKATTTTYADFSGVKKLSNAVYAGNNAKTTAGAIQLRSDKSTAGIVTTTSGGKVKKISVKWASSGNSGKSIDVYGNNNPYTAASDLYSTTGNTNQGVKIGSIVCGTSTELVIDENYPYIGIRSNSGAIYLDSISITWEKSGSSDPGTPKYSVSVATVTGGTLSASPASAEAGAEVTLSATPAAGYEFNNDWTVKDADETEIKVSDGKFIMPAKDVTVSATFKSTGGSTGGATKTFTITSDDVVGDSSYKNYTATVDNRNWVITFGGNNKSVGTNKSSRSKCNLNSYSKYAGSPITTSSTASAFANTSKIDNVSKISYSPVSSGKNQGSTVYLLYSSDNTTFSQINLTGTHKQGESLVTSGSADIVYEFEKCSGYFAVVFVANNKSGDWRLDNVSLTFTYSE